MLIAFFGIHIPLLTLLIFAVAANSATIAATTQILIIALAATLVGTALTLYVLNALLSPVTLTSKALCAYQTRQVLLNLPTHFTDEVGTLMANTSHTLTKLDKVIQHLANYDAATGLPNQTFLWNYLQQILSRQQQCAVLSIELDHSNDLTNILGQELSHVLSRIVAQRLSSCVAETDFVACLNSKEFIIVQTDWVALEKIVALSEKLLSYLSNPFYINERELHTTASIGITFYALDSMQSSELLRQADTALRQAQRQGGNTYQFYSSEMNVRLQERVLLENGLRNAFNQGELFLHYQPRIDLVTNRTIAAEALMRWHDPQRGWISPAKFIPIAEDSGLIIPIGEWALQTACAQCRAWHQRGLPVRISVNLSARQFKQVHLVQNVAQVLQETGLNPAYLELEITESLLMEDVQQAIKTLEQLREMGVRISLDDFGTGYSSMSYLQRLPINTLKVDGSFVRKIGYSESAAAIVRTIITLAHNLHLNITAEGVETKEQLDYLKLHGCHEVQGFYFSRPVAHDSFIELCR